MLYCREAFGPLPGFLVGWLGWIVHITSWGALANGLVNAATALVPASEALRPWIIIGLVVGLAAVNAAGVRMGSRLLNLLTAAKLIPIAAFIGVGVFYIRGELFVPFAPHGYAELAPATLVILYAFVGFESLTIPAGEMRDPRRSVPRALLLVMTLVTTIYFLVWAICTGTLSTLAGSANPVAEAARVFLGPIGGGLIAFGILLSVLGINANTSLVTPREVYALAYMGYLPRTLASVHAVTRAPIAAILLTSALALAIALTGSYVELAVISVVARMAQYIPTCLAVLHFRKRGEGGGPVFQVPGGAIVPIAAVLLCVGLLSQAETRHLVWGSVALLSGAVIYAPMRWASGAGDGSRPPRD